MRASSTVVRVDIWHFSMLERLANCQDTFGKDDGRFLGPRFSVWAVIRLTN
jgi:hypothetical protein